ncbi:MAG: 4-hydroxy-3-methylbut-2-enyl diphosphate reductase [Planctomycetaceae bacterium]
MQVVTAAAYGLCFGVREALALAERAADPGTVTIRGELVHNDLVLHRLDARGFARVAEQSSEMLPATPRVMITAHGISERERARLEAAGKRLIDTTCPLVRRVHRAAQAFSAEGRHVIVIGRKGHVEVRGIVEDLTSFDVVGEAAAVRDYQRPRLGVVCQSTTSPRLAHEVLAAIREANSWADIAFADTICQPTRDRQDSLQNLLPQVDAVVVVGGKNSNNTRELVALCEAAGKPSFHVQSARDLDAGWFRNVRKVGLTAGTSTLDETVEGVRQELLKMN